MARQLKPQIVGEIGFDLGGEEAVLGDEMTAALAALTLPAGFSQDDGMPVGVELLGRAFHDADLVAYGFSYERVTRHRRPPDTTPSLSHSGPVRFEIRADGSSHVPPVRSDASALAIVEYDPAARRVARPDR